MASLGPHVRVMATIACGCAGLAGAGPLRRTAVARLVRRQDHQSDGGLCAGRHLRHQRQAHRPVPHQIHSRTPECGGPQCSGRRRTDAGEPAVQHVPARRDRDRHPGPRSAATRHSRRARTAVRSRPVQLAGHLEFLSRRRLPAVRSRGSRNRLVRSGAQVEEDDQLRRRRSGIEQSRLRQHRRRRPRHSAGDREGISRRRADRAGDPDGRTRQHRHGRLVHSRRPARPARQQAHHRRRAVRPHDAASRFSRYADRARSGPPANRIASSSNSRKRPSSWRFPSRRRPAFPRNA